MKIARPDHHQLQQNEYGRHDFGVVQGDVAVQLLTEKILEEEQHEKHEEAPEGAHQRRLVRTLKREVKISDLYHSLSYQQIVGVHLVRASLPVYGVLLPCLALGLVDGT